MGSLSIGGLISGLDTDTLVAQLMAIERKPIQLLQDKKTKLQSQSDAWRDVNTRLYNLQSRAYDLKQAATFNAKAVTSSDATIASATAASTAAAGNYTIKIGQLAQAHIIASGSYASANASLGQSGTPTINGKAVTITAADTLNSIRDKINATPDIGVQASVVQVDATNFQLVVTRKLTGSTQITLADDNSALANLGLLVGGVANTIQAAQDANITVNGINVTRDSNQITDVIAGMTLSLKRAGTLAAPLEVNLEVKNDTEKVVSAVQAFVDQYNSVIEFLNDKAGYDAEKKVGGVLFGDSGANQLKTSLRQAVTAAVPGLPATLNNLAQVGVTTGAYGSAEGKVGKLTFDPTKLREQLTANLEGVTQLFGAKSVNVVANLTTVTASSTQAGSYAAVDVTNGDASSVRFGTAGGGWMGATALDGTTTEYLTIDLPTAQTIDEVRVFTLDSTEQPAASYGLKDYRVQYWDADLAVWKDAATVAGNVSGMVSSTFEAVSTNSIRLAITATNAADQFARVLEVEAYQKNLGAAVRTYDLSYGYTKSGGVIPGRQDGVSDEVKQIDDQIARMEERLKVREEALRAQFTALEQALSKMKSDSAYMTSQLAQLGV